MKVVRAKEIIRQWASENGYRLDHRASNGVWISADGTKRIVFLRNYIRFEVGGRGKWRKDYSHHTFCEGMTIKQFAEKIKKGEV